MALPLHEKVYKIMKTQILFHPAKKKIFKKSSKKRDPKSFKRL
jgi:hypothetical protein